MTPGWVATAEDYTAWTEQVIAQSGGFIAGGLAFNLWPVDEDDPLGPAVLDLLPCRLFFHDGSFLDFSFQLDIDLAYLDYRYHYAPSGGGMYWRKDMHEGHQNDDGGPHHIHCSDDDRRPYPEVDVAEAISEVLLSLWDDPTYHPCH